MSINSLNIARSGYIISIFTAAITILTFAIAINIDNPA